jgi:hypothetical protein
MWELCEDGKPTGIIVEDPSAYPNCTMYDWDYIEKNFALDMSGETVINVEEPKPITEEPTMSNSPFVVSIDGDEIKIKVKQPVIDTNELDVVRKVVERVVEKEVERPPLDTTTEYIVRWKWEYGEDDEDGSDHVIFTSMRQAKDHEGWLRKKYPSFEMTNFHIFERQVTAEVKVV